MSNGSFNSFNCTIGQQVMGNLHTGNVNVGNPQVGDLARATQLLDTLAQRLLTDMALSRADTQQALVAVTTLKAELAQPAPKLQTVEQSLSILGNLTTLAGWVDLLRPLLNNLFVD